jgi:putative transposase
MNNLGSRGFQVLTVIENWSRESLFLDVGLRHMGQSDIDALDCVGKIHKQQDKIILDHGT